MKKWIPLTKKSEKLWNKRIKESKKDVDKTKSIKLFYVECDGGDGCYVGDDNDPRKIVYISDGMYMTKDGIWLYEEDREILDF
jgi:hypothetical protein